MIHPYFNGEDSSRRAAYHAQTLAAPREQDISRKVVDRNRRDVPLGSALDDFVNARTWGIKCLRSIPMLYFNNDVNGL